MVSVRHHFFSVLYLFSFVKQWLVIDYFVGPPGSIKHTNTHTHKNTNRALSRICELCPAAAQNIKIYFLILKKFTFTHSQAKTGNISSVYLCRNIHNENIHHENIPSLSTPLLYQV